MPKTKRNKQIEIEAVDIFGGIISLICIRGYKGIDPRRRTSEQRYAYDAACVAVSKRVLELCAERDDYCTFRMVADQMHGDSRRAREELMFWLSCGLVHMRIPSDGFYYFSIGKDEAEEKLQRHIEHTGYTREMFEELTDLFESIYKEV